jgi:predicted phage tail protein
LDTTQTVAGLTNGTTYRFRMQAINANGTGGYSRVTNPVTPAIVVPGPPTITRSATAGDQTVTVSWTAPVSDGGSPLTGYVITPYIGYWQLPSVSYQSRATTQPVGGLTNGVEYRFRVQAVNAVGTSGYSMVTNPVVPTA